jgi:hypothetical protein
MLAELGQNTAEITAVLDERLREENARRIRWLGVVGAAGIAYVSAEAFITHIPIAWDSVARWIQLDAAWLEKWGPVVFAALVAIFAAIVTLIKTRRPEYGQDQPELIERAEEENILHSLDRK